MQAIPIPGKKRTDSDGQDRQRLLLSVLLSFLLYAIVIVALIILNWRSSVEMADTAGPLSVKMGNPDALDLPDIAATPQEAVTEPVTQQEVVPVTVPPPAELPKAAAPKPSPTPPVIPKPSKEAPKKPAEAVKPVPKTTTNTVPTPPVAKPPAIPTPATPAAEFKLPKGKDNGNSYETSFYNVKGFVGRNGGTPISQYMPLPRQVLGAVHDSIGTGKLTFPSASRQREIFENWYVQGGSYWQLRQDNVPLDQRDQLWAILEGAGYELRKAEYKYQNLQPVVLEFSLGVPSGSNSAPVKDIRILQSSGDRSVDEAVVYGFRAVASFSNGTGQELKGHYTYTFD